MAFVAVGGSATQRFSIDGDPYMAVGHQHPAPRRRSTTRPSRSGTPTAHCATSERRLGIGAAVTTFFAGALGWSTSRRLLRPISRVATTAGRNRLRRPRHADGPGSGPRPRPVGQVVQRHGRCRANPLRTRGPLCLRCQPRTAITHHRAHRGSRGARHPAHRPAGTNPASARRRRRPGPPLRSDGDGPARAVTHRRRLHRAAPGTGRRRRARLAHCPALRVRR